MSQQKAYLYKDGAMIVEGRADEFSKEWAAAAPADRVVLDDKRPAVRHTMREGTLYFTVHPQAWDVLKRLPRGRRIIANRTKLCELCSGELRVARELHDVWTFFCPACKSTEIHAKSIIGGTRGAGEKETL